MAAEVYFVAYDPSANHNELFKTNGTAAGTFEVTPTLGSLADPHALTAFDAKMYFAAYPVLPGPNFGYLWETDGTAAGTVQVTSSTGDPLAIYESPTALAALGTELYVDAYNPDSTTSLPVLWKTDDTVAGTINITPAGSFINSTDLTFIGNELYFSGVDLAKGFPELWKSDGTGTSAGTVEITPAIGAFDSPIDLTVVGTELYFSGLDRASGGSHVLWKSDGTPAGTVQVSSTILGGNLTAFGSELYFDGDPVGPTQYGSFLYKSDGTAAGTVEVDPSRSFFDAQNLTVVGTELYFQANAKSNNLLGIWKTDGTAGGTSEIVRTNITGNSLTSVGAELYFSARNAADTDDLWKSDGTAAGTIEITPTVGSFYNPINLTAIGNELYFSAIDPTAGRYELWKSDGTAAGTNEITSATSSYSPFDIVATTTPTMPTLTSDRSHVRVERTVIAVSAHGVLANDAGSIANDTLSVSMVNSQTAGVGHAVKGAFGTLTLQSNGSYSYSATDVPDHAVGLDAFSYTATTSQGSSASSTLTFVVTHPSQTYLGGNAGVTINGPKGDNNAVLDGGAGNDVLLAHTGEDRKTVLIGGPGDTLTGGKGEDTFAFAPNFGQNTITNFNVSRDTIQLDRSEFANIQAVLADAHEVGANTVIAFDAADTITLSGVKLSNLHQHAFHDFHIV